MENPTDGPGTLAECRAGIDAIDMQLLELLARRMALSQRVGAIKKAENRPVFDPEREWALLNNLSARAAAPLTSEAVAAIWAAILDASRSLQK